MKKIMFNDRYRLTQAVLEGRKMQTRRIVPARIINYADTTCFLTFDKKPLSEEQKDYKCYETCDGDFIDIRDLAAYRVGEEVAVAQSYNTIIQEIFDKGGEFKDSCSIFMSKGLNNKMFVHSHRMPHRISITNIRVERLQDISDEDCLKEGIMEWNPKDETKDIVINDLLEYNKRNGHFPFQIPNCWNVYDTPRAAFSDLIDKICGKGTWHSNPYVFVYDFELIK